MRTTMRWAGAIVVVMALALGSPATAPAGADPADVHLARNTWSPQYDLGGCLYTVHWGNYFNVPFTRVHFYNLSACGGAVVGIYSTDGVTSQWSLTSTVWLTGTDGCGSYEAIQATAANGISLRALVWLGTGWRFYADDGLATQPVHALC